MGYDIPSLCKFFDRIRVNCIGVSLCACVFLVCHEQFPASSHGFHYGCQMSVARRYVFYRNSAGEPFFSERQHAVHCEGVYQPCAFGRFVSQGVRRFYEIPVRAPVAHYLYSKYLCDSLAVIVEGAPRIRCAEAVLPFVRHLIQRQAVFGSTDECLHEPDIFFEQFRNHSFSLFYCSPLSCICPV